MLGVLRPQWPDIEPILNNHGQSVMDRHVTRMLIPAAPKAGRASVEAYLGAGAEVIAGRTYSKAIRRTCQGAQNGCDVDALKTTAINRLAAPNRHPRRVVQLRPGVVFTTDKAGSRKVGDWAFAMDERHRDVRMTRAFLPGMWQEGGSARSSICRRWPQPQRRNQSLCLLRQQDRRRRIGRRTRWPPTFVTGALVATPFDLARWNNRRCPSAVPRRPAAKVGQRMRCTPPPRPPGPWDACGPHRKSPNWRCTSVRAVPLPLAPPSLSDGGWSKKKTADCPFS